MKRRVALVVVMFVIGMSACGQDDDEATTGAADPSGSQGRLSDTALADSIAETLHERGLEISQTYCVGDECTVLLGGLGRTLPLVYSTEREGTCWEARARSSPGGAAVGEPIGGCADGPVSAGVFAPEECRSHGQTYPGCATRE